MDLNKLNINKVRLNLKIVFCRLIYGTMLLKADQVPSPLF